MLKMIDGASPISLSERFPHLQSEIRSLVRQDSNFRQLNDDYGLLLRSLRDTKNHSDDDKEEIIRLKASLEFEALELLSQTKSR